MCSRGTTTTVGVSPTVTDTCDELKLGEETPLSGTRSRSDVTLDRAECEGLLASRNVGRLGLVIDGHPYVIPTHYATPGGGVIVFRAALRSLLMEASLREVAFEVDDAQPKTRTGWFVTVIGVARDIADAIDETSMSLRQLPIVEWSSEDRPEWFKVGPLELIGHRLTPSSPQRT
jgi:uncharacterized protein